MSAESHFCKKVASSFIITGVKINIEDTDTCDFKAASLSDGNGGRRTFCWLMHLRAVA